MSSSSIEKLVLVRRISDRYGIDCNDLRPCIAQIIDGEALLDGKNEHAAFLLAIDLKHVGIPISRITEIMTESRIANPKHIEYAVNSAKNDKYRRMACVSNTMGYELDQIRQYMCVGTEHCLWYAQNEGKGKQKFRNEDDRKFEKYGWHHICSPSEYILYIKIRELERIHRAGTGGMIVATHDMLANMVGCTRRSVKNVIEGLRARGLIEYRVGDSTRKEKRASQIMRVIPVPKPGMKYERKLTEFNQYDRHRRIAR